MSGEAEASQADLDLKALEDFLVGNRDLERLEALLDRFNFFEATGFIRQELRHSDFLAFLMDPRGNHGLGAAFVKRLLQSVLMVAGDVPVSVIPRELDQWDLGRVEVRREWQHIDILVLDEDHKLAVIVENKIGTGEHDDQLPRYYGIVEEHYPGWEIIAVYLTPRGDAPSLKSYLPVGYDLVCEVMGDLTEDKALVADDGVRTLLSHYVVMMRRNILPDSDVARLCRKIYQDHKRALDLIIDHRPDPPTDIGSLLLDLIDSDRRVATKRRTRKPYIYFYPTEWANSPHGPLDFVFHNHPGSLDLYIEVTWKDEEARRRLFDVARRHESLFDWFVEKPKRGLNPKLYRRTFLTGRHYEEAGDSDREDEIRRVWTDFLDGDLPRIDAVLRGERWVWGSDEPDEGISGRRERFGWGDGDIEITRRSDELQG